MSNEIVKEWTYPNVEHESDRKQALLKLRLSVFQILCDIAFPIVVEHRSDLYHDVTWLEEHLVNVVSSAGMMLYQQINYSVDEYGTCIGFEDFVLGFRSGAAYVITITAYVNEFSTDWKIVAVPYGDTYTAEEETAEILADPDTMAAIAEAESEG